MSSGAEEISKNVEAISTVARQSASGAEAISTTAERLNQQTDTLQSLLNQFTLKGDASENYTETARQVIPEDSEGELKVGDTVKREKELIQ